MCAPEPSQGKVYAAAALRVGVQAGLLVAITICTHKVHKGSWQ